MPTPTVVKLYCRQIEANERDKLAESFLDYNTLAHTLCCEKVGRSKNLAGTISQIQVNLSNESDKLAESFLDYNTQVPYLMLFMYPWTSL